MRRALLLCVLSLPSCKKQEAAKDGPPAEQIAATVAATAPSASVDPSAAASASAAPHEHTAAEIEAEQQAESHTARAKAMEDARQFGMLGLIGMDAGGSDVFGSGGLGLNGVGEGGGRGEGIGLGNIGTIGGRTTLSDAGARRTRRRSVRAPSR